MGFLKKLANAVDKVQSKLANKWLGDEGEDLAREIEQDSKDDKGKDGKK